MSIRHTTKFMQTLLLGSLLVATAAHAETIQPAVQLPPDARIFKTHSGDTIDLNKWIGKKPVYLKFWASWCQPCRAEMPHLQQIYLRNQSDMVVLSVNIQVNETPESIQKIIDKYGLTVPVLLDSQDALAQYVNFKGTPYHLLTDAEGKLAYAGYEANETLNLALSQLQSKADISVADAELKLNPVKTREQPDSGIYYFTATWCDWYLQDTHPEMAEQCVATNAMVNRLATKGFDIKGYVTRLWTTDDDLADYRKKFGIIYSVAIDADNEKFYSMGIHQYPTLVVLQGEKELERITDFSDMAAVEKRLKTIPSLNMPVANP